MSSTEKTPKEASGQKFPCDLCPYVAKTTDSLENHAKHHVLNPDADFVCKKCPFYCFSKIELGIHSMVHAMQRRPLDASEDVPVKKLKVDTESISKSPPQMRSRMSPFKKASSVSPTQKSLKKAASTSLLKERRRDSIDSGGRASPTKSLWKVKLRGGSPSPALSALSPGNKKNTAQSEDQDDVESVASSTDSRKSKKRNSIVAATCSLCPQTFTMKSNLHKHKKYHTPSPDRPHKCTYCSFACGSKASVNIHMGLHLEAVDNSGPKYSPEEEAATLQDEDESGDEEENEEVKYKCEKCPYTTVHRRLIKVHRKQHFPSAERQACCPHCPYYVTVKHALARHLAVHRDVQSDVSSKRDSISTTSTMLDESQTADDEAEDNESVATNKSDLSEEGKSKKKMYVCQICPYRTPHLNLMHTHKIQHTPSEDRPACCDYCPYYVTVKHALSRHMLVHKEHRDKKNQYEKIHHEIASQLDSSQNDENVKEELMEEDTEDEEEKVEDMDEDDTEGDGEDDGDGEGAQKYACEICRYTTVHRRLIKVHRSQHTPSAERQACCPYCPYYVAVQHGLYRHLMVHDEHRKKMNLPPLETASRHTIEANESYNEADEVEDSENVHSEEDQDDDDDGDGSDTDMEVEYEEKPQEKVYACNICPYTTVHRRLIQVHMSKHAPSPTRQARCDYCPYYGAVKSLLKKHMAVHQEYRDLKSGDGDVDNSSKDEENDEAECKCELCPYETTSNSSLKRHIEFHSASEERQVQCPYCPYFVRSQARLANHLIVHKEHSAKGNEEMLVCDVCPYKTSSTVAMEGHSQHHSPRIDHPHKCPICPYYAKTVAQIERHAKLHPIEKTPEKTPKENNQSGKKQKKNKPYCCSICPYQGHDNRNFHRHQELHTPSEERKIKCDYCPFYVNQRSGLVHHVPLHVGNQEETTSPKTSPKSPRPRWDGFYVCTVCPYTTEYSHELKKHRVHHTPRAEWPTKCRFCPFYAANFNGLSRHIPLHTEYQVEKFSPKKPEEKTGSPEKQEVKEDRKEGIEMEEGEDEHQESIDGIDNLTGIPYHYRCSLCPYIGQPNKLKKHMEMHTPSDKRQAKCPLCPFYVKSSASLGSHMHIHNKAKGDDEDVVQFRYKHDDEGADVSSEEEMATDEDSGNEHDANDESKARSRSKVNKYQCNNCPYVARRAELDIHVAGHKPNPKNIFQCNFCSYAHANKSALNSHFKVHQPDYVRMQMLQYKVHLDVNQMNDFAPASPAKSDISDVSDCDVLEMANIKQQLITAKIISAPVSKTRFKCETEDLRDDKECMIEGLMVDKDGKMKVGFFKTMFRCPHCPYANIHQEKLEQHELAHSNRTGKYKCSYCSYKTEHKILRNRHTKVHAYQYVPGAKDINDYECGTEEETDEGEEDEEEDMEVSFKEAPAEDEESKKEAEKLKMENKADISKQLPRAAIKSPDGNSIKIKSKPILSINDLPAGMEYYVRQDKITGQNYLERASVKKWCCEKCPYATMDKDCFENHSMLHASHQRNVCEFCDYSVPVYNFLLEHRKLHLQPNQNLLAMQSVTNLLSLPEVPADVAAAVNFPGETDDPISRFGTHDHMDLYENSDQYTEPRKLYHCDRCPYTNVRRENLLAHMRFHMIKSELKCDYCDYSVGKHELLVQHIRVHFVDPDTIKLDLNSNPVISKSSEDTPPPSKTVLRDSAKMNAKSSEKKDHTKGLKRDAKLKSNDEDADVEDLNNNSSSWICQYCDRAFCESDRLLRHEMQHLIGQRL